MKNSLLKICHSGKDKLQHLFGLKDKLILLEIVVTENNIDYISTESPEIKTKSSAYEVILMGINKLYHPAFNISLINSS